MKKSIMKKILSAFAMVIFSAVAFAQSGTNSPYSQYGLGVLSDQGNSFNRGMNGVGIALSHHNQVNYINPASYSQIDSLSFIFDVGMSLQMTNFKEGTSKKNAKNADFEYAVGGFRLAKHFGLGFGLIPFSNIGYNYSTTGEVKREDTNKITTYTNTYNGSGGIHEIFVGLGWMPIKGLSLGVNGGYLWGEMNRTFSNVYSDTYASTLSKAFSASVSSYKLSMGLQYSVNIGKKDIVTVGATYDLGHKLGSKPTLETTTTNTQAVIADSTTLIAENALELPAKIGIGIAYNHNNKWNVAMDYTIQKWGDVVYPKYDENAIPHTYRAVKGLFNDRQKFNIGAEYCQNTEGRSFASRVRYRIGASYTTPYLKINGKDGPKEIGVSGGIAFPIINAFNNRSILSISAQWVNSSSKEFITENTFRINIGLTFNERWFAKWKFD